MKKKLLKQINLLLGAASVALAGCHIQKKSVEPTPAQDPAQPAMEEQVQPAEEPVCLYGVPAEVYERPMRKYGVPDAAE